MQYTLTGNIFSNCLEINNARFAAPKNSVPDSATVRVKLELTPYDKNDWREGYQLRGATSVINGKQIDWMTLLDDPWQLTDLVLDEMVEDDNARKYG